MKKISYRKPFIVLTLDYWVDVSEYLFYSLMVSDAFGVSRREKLLIVNNRKFL